MHPWHDVELGKKFPKVCTAVVEIPRDTNTKYKLDAKTGLLKLGECLPTVARYPANYGFFPRTVAADGDALDVFIFGAIPFLPLTMVEVRVLGGAETVSKKKGTELKLIAVCPGDPEFARIETLRQLSKFYLDQLSQFFATYRQEEGDVRRLVDFYGKKRALHLLKQAARDYADQAAKGQLE